jgi:hypothetical protein
MNEYLLQLAELLSKVTLAVSAVPSDLHAESRGLVRAIKAEAQRSAAVPADDPEPGCPTHFVVAHFDCPACLSKMNPAPPPPDTRRWWVNNYGSPESYLYESEADADYNSYRDDGDFVRLVLVPATALEAAEREREMWQARYNEALSGHVLERESLIGDLADLRARVAELEQQLADTRCLVDEWRETADRNARQPRTVTREEVEKASHELVRRTFYDGMVAALSALGIEVRS